MGVPLHDDAGVAERIRRTLLASDFAFDTWFRQPQLLAPQGLERLRSGSDASARIDALKLTDDEATCLMELRRFRHAEALRLVFRDVNGLDELPETLSATSVLYEALLGASLSWSERAMAARYGHSRSHDGVLQRMVVVGFGKLGGSELNFSSDIDLVLAYPHSGQSDGARSLDNSEYFVRLARQLVRLLNEPTMDGICARVDLRLRPFGNAGRLALPFSAMEQYYQSEGRDWERYAWIKARPVAGDRHGGKQLQELLRPFVYRRYLDYTAFAGLREMKALIDAEVARKDLADNLKLGPGGIREIEFVVQLVQLIRGGREPSLRVRGLLPALAACEARGHISMARARALREAYIFLRRVENRVQMLRDAQTHDIPEDALSRERIARGLGHACWEELELQLAQHRAHVSEEFAEVLMPQGGRTASAPVADVALWQQACAETLDAGAMEASGFTPGAEVAEAVQKLSQAASVRAMPQRSREQLDRLMPQLLAVARDSAAPAACLLQVVPSRAGGGASLFLPGVAGGAACGAPAARPFVRRERLSCRARDCPATVAGRCARPAHRAAAAQARGHRRRDYPRARHPGRARGRSGTRASQRIQGQRRVSPRAGLQRRTRRRRSHGAPAGGAGRIHRVGGDRAGRA